MPEFGHTFKEKHFPASANSFVPVNHGARGLHPKCVMDRYHQIADHDLAAPDVFAKFEQEKLYEDALKATANLLNCSHKNLALVSCDTLGINDVLRSLPFQPGDTIAMALTAFDTCSKMVRHVCSLMKLRYVVVDVSLPMLDAQMVEQFEKVFQREKITLALFDTVSSMPGARLPFVDLTNLCRKFGVMSLVDGAHLIGLLPIDLSDSLDFRPDFYTSNLHKWLFVPRGCAVLYVDKKHHRTIQPMPLLHAYVDPTETLSPAQLEDHFWTKFVLEGAKWFPSLACVPEAIKFRQEVCGGEANIREYCFLLAQEVAGMIETGWPGTKVIENDTNSLTTAMVSASVPLSEEEFALVKADFSSFNNHVLNYTVERYQTVVPMCLHNGMLVFRFCCQIYNEKADFEHALEAVRSAILDYLKSRD